MPGPEVITFGCRLNIAESEAMKALAGDDPNLVIINSCAVTARRCGRRGRQSGARRERPEARIIVTGCGAQTDPALFAAMPEVDQRDRQCGKMKLSRPIAAPSHLSATEKVRVNDIMAVRETAPHMIDRLFADHTRAFVEVQNGCDHRCTFCIIPYGRGNSRSVPAGAVIDQSRRWSMQGYREVVLTGVDVTSYGADLPGSPSLGSAGRAHSAQVPDLPRLRLSSIDSVEIDERLFDAA
jgi:threonylcarbamoyladenosine tRNA methylthiotransferase MtaB